MTRRGVSVPELLVAAAILALLAGAAIRGLAFGTRSTGRLTPQLALKQNSRKAIVRFLRELQEGMEVVSPAPGRTLSHAIVRDKVSRARWFYQVAHVMNVQTRHELWRHVDDTSLPKERRAELLLTDVKRLAFTSRGEGSLQVNLTLAEGESEYTLLTTVRLRNIASAEEVW